MCQRIAGIGWTMLQAAEWLLVHKDLAEGVSRQLCFMESDRSRATLLKDPVFSNVHRFICDLKVNTRGTFKSYMGVGKHVQSCKKCDLSISLAPGWGGTRQHSASCVALYASVLSMVYLVPHFFSHFCVVWGYF